MNTDQLEALEVELDALRYHIENGQKTFALDTLRRIRATQASEQQPKAEPWHPCAMTPEAQRIAIAEACGFTAQEIEGLVSQKSYGATYRLGKPIPDYLNDLNAIHEAERTCLVTFKDGVKWRDYRNEYSDQLWMICAPSRSGCEAGWGFPMYATAAQRAEAFLRTLGLWKE